MGRSQGSEVGNEGLMRLPWSCGVSSVGLRKLHEPRERRVVLTGAAQLLDREQMRLHVGGWGIGGGRLYR